jgi:uncharacterized membrane-anchored protein YitT (DUF2179 family)
MFWIAIGQFIAAIAFNLILIPNHLVAVGLGGLATVLNNLCGFNIQITLILLSSPILVWALFRYEKRQVFFATYSFGIFTFYIGLINQFFKPFITDTIVAAAAGGLLLGVAAGIILRQGVANGPESIVGMYLKDKKGITVGNFFMVFNTVIIFSSILYGDLTFIIYSLISNYISSKITDYVIIGNKRYYVVNIMTDNYFDVTDFIRKELKRGVTFVQGLDTSNVKKKIMVKTVVSNHELVLLKEYIKNLKDDSFVYVTESAGLIGGGFE